MMAHKVFNKMSKKGFTIAFSESLTGGSISFELVKIPGASTVYLGSIIAYQKDSKIKLLDIKQKTIDQFSVVSKEVAIEMAAQARTKFNSSIGVGITGNAGPSYEAKSQYQIAYLAIDILGDISWYKVDLDALTRLQAIRKATQFTYQKLDELIN